MILHFLKKVAIAIIFIVVCILFALGIGEAQDLPPKPEPIPAVQKSDHKKLTLALELGTIFAATSADGITTCQALARGGTEQNIILGPHPRCGSVIAFSIGAGTFYTVIHIIDRHNFDNDPARGWRLVGHLAMPVFAGILHGRSAYQNSR